MKFIRWLIPLPLAASIIAIITINLTAEAAVGDPIVLLTSATATLDGPEKGCFASWISDVLPGGTPANMATVRCSRKKAAIWCAATERVTDASAAEHTADEASGRIVGYESMAVDGSTATYIKAIGRRKLSAAESVSLRACIASPWPAVTPNNVIGINLARDSAGVATGTVDEIKTVTHAARIQCLASNMCSQLVGVVVE